MGNKTKKIINNNLYIIVFAVGFLLLEYYQRYRLTTIVDNFEFFEGLSFIFSITFVSVLSFILILLPRRYKAPYIVISYVAIVSFLIANNLYKDMFREFLSIRQITMVKEAHNYYSRFGDFINDTYKFARIDYLVMIIVGITLLVVTIKLQKKSKTNNKKKIVVVLLMLIIISNLIGVRTIENSNDSKWQIFDNKTYLYNTLFRKDYSIEQFGIFGFLKRDIELSIRNGLNVKDEESIDSIESYFEENVRYKTENEYTGIFEGKNLIFILAESLTDYNITPELMPTLNMMKNEGMYFDNFYIPAYPRTTCDSEFIFQTGLLPSLYSGPTCYFYHENEYPNSMANLFIDKDYKANSFHNNIGEFYNRYELHESYGFQNFYDSERLGMDLLIDSNIYELGKDKLFPEDNYYDFIISYSGHGGYTEKDLLRKAYYEKNFAVTVGSFQEDTPIEILVNNAFQMEFDNMLKKIYNDLEEKGELEDTVFVILPDHYPYLMDKETYTSYYPQEYDYQYHHLPMIIWNPELEPTTVSKLGTTVDVLPTIANMFNLDYDPNNYFGVDLMDPNSESIVLFKDYSWLNSETYYSPKFKTGTIKSDDYYNNINEELYKRIDIFQKILLEDYYSKKN